MTLTLPRRKFLTLAAGLVAAPVIVRVGSIMPVKAPDFIQSRGMKRIMDLIAEGDTQGLWVGAHGAWVDAGESAQALRVVQQGSQGILFVNCTDQPVFLCDDFLFPTGDPHA